MAPIDELAAEDFCYITTTGRRTGKPHTIEIWFALHDDSLYILSDRRADWVRNAVASADVSVRIGGREFTGRARLVEGPPEAQMARDLVFGKYVADYGSDLTHWRDSAQPVAVDIGPD